MIEFETETIPMKRMRLRDSIQKYTNMLTCIHDLKITEREQILAWKAADELELESIPTEEDAESIIHP